MKQATRLVLIGAAVVTLLGCDQQHASDLSSASLPSDNQVTVKIGQASPMSGPNAHLGKDSEHGATLAIDDLNAEELIIGDKRVRFELLSEDDQGSPKISVQVAQRLVDNGVVGVVGHLNSGTTIPASKIYSDANLPQITPSATAPMYTRQGFKTTFRIIANDLQQAKAIGNFVMDRLKAKKIAIIDDRTIYGQSLADEFEKTVKAKGGSVVKRVFTTNTNNNFKTVLVAMQGASAPDIIFYGGLDTQAAALATQMKQLGCHAKLIGGDGQKTVEFIKLAAAAAEGQYASGSGIPYEQTAVFTAFRRRFKAKFRAEIQRYAPYEYDALNVLVAAMKRANSTDPKVYLTEISKTHFTGITGNIAFDAQGDLKQSAITIYQVREGRWEPIFTMNE